MANKDIFKQAIAEAKSVREAAIANAKEALEESLTPHLKDMLAAKLQEMEDKDVSEEEVNEMEDDMEEGKEMKDEVVAEDEMEDDMEDADDADDMEDDMDDEAEDDEPAEDEDLTDLSVEDFKDLIRDVIATEMGGDEMGDMAADMDAGAMDAEMGAEEPAMDAGAEEDTIDLDELLAELEADLNEGDDEDKMEEGKEDKMEEGDKDKMDEETIEEDTDNQQGPDAEEDNVGGKPKNVNRTVKENKALRAALKEAEARFEDAANTVEVLREELNEVNILNAKLLYVNKIFKANDLSESQKVNVIAAFDKAETVKEVKLVFETVADNFTKKERVKQPIKESKGLASKATGTTASKKEVISEVSDAVKRMQQLAGIV